MPSMIDAISGSRAVPSGPQLARNEPDMYLPYFEAAPGLRPPPVAGLQSQER